MRRLSAVRDSGTAALAAVNGALEAAVPVFARELAPVRVNAVSPGVIETGWWDELPEEDRRATFEQFAQIMFRSTSPKSSTTARSQPTA